MIVLVYGYDGSGPGHWQRWLHDALRQSGVPVVFPEYIARGLYLGVIETACRYLKPARYDDDLVIRAAVTDMGRARLQIDYAVVGSDGVVRALGHTVHAVLDDAGRPQRIPADFRAAALTSQRDAGGGPTQA